LGVERTRKLASVPAKSDLKAATPKRFAGTLADMHGTREECLHGIIRPQALRKQGLWLPLHKMLVIGQLNPGINFLIKTGGGFSWGQ
jgi:hypothetical protein